MVVNDNDMSIAENHGGIYDNLRELRETNGQAKTNYFKSIGFDYKYVAYGNDIESLIRAFSEVKDIDHPVVVHICTQKGMGYAPAEADREKFHYGLHLMCLQAEALSISEAPSYDDIIARHLMDMAKTDPTVAVITAGTPGVLALTPERRRNGQPICRCGHR